MPNLIDSATGAQIVPGMQLGSGGEGRVFDVSNRPGFVAKVFHSSPSQEKIQKLAAMISMSSASLVSMTAWPASIVLDERRTPIGLLMPKVAGYKDVHQFYSPKSRKLEFPNADFKFLLHVAANVARAFGAVHKAGVVIGDVNHGGVTVAQNGTVKLIDCDSFQIKANGHSYLCEVGVPTFTPPELQGRSFRGIERTTNHDNFGLAILLFHILFMGKHPFAGTYLGRGDMPIETAIQQFRFVYGADGAKKEMRPPPFAPTLLSLSPGIAKLFERAFAPSSSNGSGRPGAEDWLKALSELSSGSKMCKASPSHLYSASLAACPWCQFENSVGISLFNVVLGPITQGQQFDLSGVWRTIEAITASSFPPAASESDFPTPHPEADAITAGRLRSGFKLKQFGRLPVAGIITGGAIALAPQAFIFWIICGFVIYAVLGNSSVDPALVYETRLRGAEATRLALQHRYANQTAQWLRLDAKKRELQSRRDVLQSLAQKRAARLQKLSQDRHQAQLERFLGNFFLEHAKISGIGPGRKAVLESYNIETAADIVKYKITSVPGFGEAMAKKLVAWRKDIEKRFKFDPTLPVDAQQIALLDQELYKERKSAEQSLSSGPTELLQLKRQIELQAAQVRQELEDAVRAVAQARANLKAARA